MIINYLPAGDAREVGEAEGNGWSGLQCGTDSSSPLPLQSPHSHVHPHTAPPPVKKRLCINANLHVIIICLLSQKIGGGGSSSKNNTRSSRSSSCSCGSPDTFVSAATVARYYQGAMYRGMRRVLNNTKQWFSLLLEDILPLHSHKTTST